MDRLCFMPYQKMMTMRRMGTDAMNHLVRMLASAHGLGIWITYHLIGGFSENVSTSKWI
jgi:hypothetical protein